MPNHVWNELYLEGEPEAMEQLRRELQMEGAPLGSLDFEKVIPMPTSLHIESGSKTNQAIRVYLTALSPWINWLESEEDGYQKVSRAEFRDLGESLKSYKPFASMEEFQQIVKVDELHELLELGRQAVKNQQQYGAITWYEWCMENWGTKWNSYDAISSKDAAFVFQTAWSPPDPVMQRLSEQYPVFTIRHRWADEDFGYNLGERTYQAGSVIAEEWFEMGSSGAIAYAAELWGVALEEVYESREEEEQTKKEKQIDILVVEPGKHPYSKTIDNTLEAMQEVVGGWIEPIYLEDGNLIVVNEEGKLIGLEGNRRLGNDVLVGTFFVVGDGGEQFASLSKERQEFYMERFQEPEDITQDEILAATQATVWVMR